MARTSVVVLTVIALVSLVRCDARAQGRDVQPGEAVISISYSTCLVPAEPLRIAMSEEDQLRVPGCRRWSTFERAGKELEANDYVPANPGAMPALNSFLRDVIPALYKVSAPTYSAKDLYERFRVFNWQEVDPSQAKTGALIVWPQVAAVVVNDVSTADSRKTDRLAGLTLLYPSYLRGGRLSVIDAKSLHASFGNAPAPKIIIPTPRKSLFWNTWVERPSGETVVDHILVEDQSYVVMLDLSRFDYLAVAPPLPGAADPATQRYIDELTAKYPDLRILVTTVGRGLRLGGTTVVYERGVKRERLAQPPPKGRAARQTVSEFASEAGALSEPVDSKPQPVRVRVDAVGAGCAGVAFSVWNAPMTRLVDYVVRTIAIARSDGTVPDCRPAPGIAVGVDAPRLQMLSLESSRDVNASLHVFERQGPSDVLTVVVYAHDRAEFPTPLTWSIPVRLSQLEQHLKEFLEANAESRLYLREIGSMIRDHFFTAANDRDQEQADLAIASLKQLSDLSDGDRSVFVRFANSASQPVFIPMHLLAVDATRPEPLGVRVDVVHPLPPPLDPTPSAANCVDSLNFVISPQVVEALKAKSELGKIEDQWRFKVIKDWDEFVSYVQALQPLAKSEGLVIMAHHGPDAIAFSKNQPQGPITSQRIRRRFHAGSVALLAACSVANISEANTGRQILARLNDRGIGAAVVSPFPVPEEVSARLILSFARRAGEAKQRHEKVTLGALFRQAIGDVIVDTANLDDLERLRAHEFMLVGNAAISLCDGSP